MRKVKIVRVEMLGQTYHKVIDIDLNSLVRCPQKAEEMYRMLCLADCAAFEINETNDGSKYACCNKFGGQIGEIVE